MICGTEFGLDNVGNVALIRRALYGGKSTGRHFRNYVREFMFHIVFVPCLDDPDVWMCEGQKSNGTAYWIYVMLYVKMPL